MFAMHCAQKCIYISAKLVRIIFDRSDNIIFQQLYMVYVDVVCKWKYKNQYLLQHFSFPFSDSISTVVMFEVLFTETLSTYPIRTFSQPILLPSPPPHSSSALHFLLFGKFIFIVLYSRKILYNGCMQPIIICQNTKSLGTYRQHTQTLALIHHQHTHKHTHNTSQQNVFLTVRKLN